MRNAFAFHMKGGHVGDVREKSCFSLRVLYMTEA